MAEAVPLVAGIASLLGTGASVAMTRAEQSRLKREAKTKKKREDQLLAKQRQKEAAALLENEGEVAKRTALMNRSSRSLLQSTPRTGVTTFGGTGGENG